MKALRQYGKSMQVVLVITGILTLGFCWYAWMWYDNGILDYRAFRDKAAVKKMFHDDWQWLQYGDWDKISEDEYDVDFMLDNRSSSQTTVNNKLVLKVLRESGKTVGFLAYHPN